MFDAHRASRGRWQRGVLGTPGLNTGFLIRREDKFRPTEGPAFPESGIEIEDAPRLVGENRIAGEDPGAVLPWTNGVGTQPTPERCPADLDDDSLRLYFLADVGQGEARQR